MKKVLYIDIETIPAPESFLDGVEIKAPATHKKPESIAAWIAENGDAYRDEQHRKTSFNGGWGSICQISWAIDDGEIDGAALGPDRANERDMLFGALDAIEGQLSHANNPYLCGHFISGFDLKFIKHRCIVLGIKYPQWLLPSAKPWDDGIRDTMQLWAGARDTISLDNLCKILGIKGKEGFDGSMVYDAWLAGEHAKITAYCAADVAKVRTINEIFLKAGI